MKDIELRLISELMKNSRRSDRELSRVLGISQPTVSRMVKRFEKEGVVEYTAIPNLVKLGYEIIAVVFGKRNYQKHPEINLQKAENFAKEHPNIIFGAPGNGLGYDRISISIHKNYSDYDRFIKEIQDEWADIMMVDSFLIYLKNENVVRPISLKHFGDDLKREKKLE